MLAIVVLFLFGAVSAAISSKSDPGQVLRDDFVAFPAAKDRHDVSSFRAVAQLLNPIGRTHIVSAKDAGCPGRAPTSATASTAGCKAAINAGFFNVETGDCVGNVISRGSIAQISGLRNVNFGITQNGTFVTGYLTQSTVENKNSQLKELVAGLVWLIREGKPYYVQSNAIEGSDFMDLPAPRTMIGHDKLGHLYLVVTEGVESDIKSQQMGLTIPQLAKVAQSLSLYSAINLDGGGSSTFVFNGLVRNNITEPCVGDRSRFCERPVTTIVCIDSLAL